MAPSLVVWKSPAACSQVLWLNGTFTSAAPRPTMMGAYSTSFFTISGWRATKRLLVTVPQLQPSTSSFFWPETFRISAAAAAASSAA